MRPVPVGSVRSSFVTDPVSAEGSKGVSCVTLVFLVLMIMTLCSSIAALVISIIAYNRTWIPAPTTVQPSTSYTLPQDITLRSLAATFSINTTNFLSTQNSTTTQDHNVGRDVNVGRNLNVQFNQQVGGSVTINQNQYIGGSSTIIQNQQINGNLGVDGQLNVQGIATLDTLHVVPGSFFVESAEPVFLNTIYGYGDISIAGAVIAATGDYSGPVSAASYTTTSSQTVKENIVAVTNFTQIMDTLRIFNLYTYTYTKNFTLYNGVTNQTQFGGLAEQFCSVEPQMCATAVIVDGFVKKTIANGNSTSVINVPIYRKVSGIPTARLVMFLLGGIKNIDDRLRAVGL